MKKTLVFGASTRINSYSNLAIRRLIEKNIDVVAFGKASGKVNNITIETEKKLFNHLDTITLYMNPVNQQKFYDYIISLQPKRVIFNPGTENPEFYMLLKENNIAVEVACTLVLLSTNQY